MSNAPEQPDSSNANSTSAALDTQLERGTYEIIRNRLKSHAGDLQSRLHQLNDARREVFGSIPTKLISTQRITTSHNCTPQDIVPVGSLFVFGYNVHMGLKKVTELEDVDPDKRDLARLAHLVETCFLSSDYQEGRRAFMEKRPAQFEGR